MKMPISVLPGQIHRLSREASLALETSHGDQNESARVYRATLLASAAVPFLKLYLHVY